MRFLPLFALLLLAACAQTVPAPVPVAPSQPTYLGGGQGSQNGNYETRETGEQFQAGPDVCPIYAWDRPISGGRIIRYLSAACPAPQPGRPDAVRMIDLGRHVLPASDSTLDDKASYTIGQNS
ncbi:hypothetical protein [Niveispirillum sp.]|uniref:hypothetical protein n=1 Tax=Niveispirillum sp. TaxID=1917217 RepID=UPI001B749848|nr:hypothetical protein [Niveispirillum sp.]MBP7340559.1 hypothetical protein [Niveispirillum sp.]